MNKTTTDSLADVISDLNALHTVVSAYLETCIESEYDEQTNLDILSFYDRTDRALIEKLRILDGQQSTE